jgi:hypothetical protein
MLLPAAQVRSNTVMKLPQLHLRDLFWLVLTIGLAMAWLLDHRRLAPYLPAHMKLMKHFTAIVEGLAQEGIGMNVDPNTQEVFSTG